MVNHSSSPKLAGSPLMLFMSANHKRIFDLLAYNNVFRTLLTAIAYMEKIFRTLLTRTL